MAMIAISFRPVVLFCLLSVVVAGDRNFASGLLGGNHNQLQPRVQQTFASPLAGKGKRLSATSESSSSFHSWVALHPSAASLSNGSNEIGSSTASPKDPQVATDSNGMEAGANKTLKSSTGSSKKVLLKLFGVCLSSVVLIAKAGLLGPYTNAMIARDVGATVFCALGALIVVKAVELGYQSEMYPAKISRKLVHILSAPIFVAFWPLFTASEGARFFASIVTFVNGVKLFRAGTGKDDGLAKAVSRSGDISEALGGPFVYICIVQLAILTLWRSHPAGIVALSTMAVGDGMADLVGRRFGRNNKWFFSKHKSIAGTLAFAGFSAIASTGLLLWMIKTGCMTTALPWKALFARILAVSSLSSIVELLPVGDDNWTVPLTAGVLSAVLLR